MAAAVKEAGVMCFVAFQRRFDANFMRLKEAITGGEVGDVHMAHIVSRDPSPPPIAYIKVTPCPPIGLHSRWGTNDLKFAAETCFCTVLL